MYIYIITLGSVISALNPSCSIHKSKYNLKILRKMLTIAMMLMLNAVIINIKTSSMITTMIMFLLIIMIMITIIVILKNILPMHAVGLQIVKMHSLLCTVG